MKRDLPDFHADAFNRFQTPTALQRAEPRYSERRVSLEAFGYCTVLVSLLLASVGFMVLTIIGLQ